jgi:uncharacterized membrane protein
MTSYFLVKYLHIVSSTILFGTGVGIAFFKWRSDKSGNIKIIRPINELTVLADWIFTTPSVIVQPLTGLWLVHTAGYPLFSGWLVPSVCLYLCAGACWLPVVWLQLRMRALSRTADETQTPLPSLYWTYARVWFWLGIPAFTAIVAVFGLMVLKPSLN